MKPRFILFLRGRTYYCEDTQTHKQLSLRTRHKTEAQALLNAKNEAFRQPMLNQECVTPAWEDTVRSPPLPRPRPRGHPAPATTRAVRNHNQDGCC